MCLERESSIRVTDKDITVYKCMIATENKKFRSIFYNTKVEYELNKIYKVNIFIDSSNNVNSYGFHSFLYLSSCEAYKNIDEYIIKCTIPKDSIYILGKQVWYKKDNLYKFSAIRSNKIILNEVL